MDIVKYVYYYLPHDEIEDVYKEDEGKQAKVNFIEKEGESPLIKEDEHTVTIRDYKERYRVLRKENVKIIRDKGEVY